MSPGWIWQKTSSPSRKSKSCCPSFARRARSSRPPGTSSVKSSTAPLNTSAETRPLNALAPAGGWRCRRIFSGRSESSTFLPWVAGGDFTSSSRPPSSRQRSNPSRSAERIRLDDVGFANECRDEPAGWTVIDFVDRTDLFHPSGAHYRDAIAHAESFLLVVGDEDESDAKSFLKLLELDPHLRSQFRIKGAQGLVEKKNFRLADNRPGEGDTLALAAGQLRRLAVDKILQRRHLDDPIDAPADIRPGDFFHPQSKGNVFVDRKVGKEGVALKHLIDTSPIGRFESDVLAADEDVTSGRSIEAADQSQTRRFPAARRTEKGHEFAFRNLKADVSKRRKGAKTLANVAEFHHRGHPLASSTHSLAASEIVELSGPAIGLSKSFLAGLGAVFGRLSSHRGRRLVDAGREAPCRSTAKVGCPHPPGDLIFRIPWFFKDLLG